MLNVIVLLITTHHVHAQLIFALLRGLFLFAANSAVQSSQVKPAQKPLASEDGEKPQRAQRSYSVTRLAAYPILNVIVEPIMTHQVHGTGVPSHRYNSTPKPKSIPTMMPR